MSLLSSLKSMFSSNTAAPPEKALPGEEYKGYLITPSPVADGSQFRVNGLIEKGEQQHRFIRADVLPSKEACAEEMIRKSKLMIDQVGDSFF